jgi:hypothetical protein
VAALTTQERELRVQLQRMQTDASTLVTRLHGRGSPSAAGGDESGPESAPGGGASAAEKLRAENESLRLEIQRLLEAGSKGKEHSTARAKCVGRV